MNSCHQRFHSVTAIPESRALMSRGPNQVLEYQCSKLFFPPQFSLPWFPYFLLLVHPSYSPSHLSADNLSPALSQAVQIGLSIKGKPSILYQKSKLAKILKLLDKLTEQHNLAHFRENLKLLNWFIAVKYYDSEYFSKVWTDLQQRRDERGKRNGELFSLFHTPCYSPAFANSPHSCDWRLWSSQLLH